MLYRKPIFDSTQLLNIDAESETINSFYFCHTTQQMFFDWKYIDLILKNHS